MRANDNIKLQLQYITQYMPINTSKISNQNIINLEYHICFRLMNNVYHNYTRRYCKISDILVIILSKLNIYDIPAHICHMLWTPGLHDWCLLLGLTATSFLFNSALENV